MLSEVLADTDMADAGEEPRDAGEESPYYAEWEQLFFLIYHYHINIVNSFKGIR